MPTKASEFPFVCFLIQHAIGDLGKALLASRTFYEVLALLKSEVLSELRYLMLPVLLLIFAAIGFAPPTYRIF